MDAMLKIPAAAGDKHCQETEVPLWCLWRIHTWIGIVGNLPRVIQRLAHPYCYYEIAWRNETYYDEKSWWTKGSRDGGEEQSMMVQQWCANKKHPSKFNTSSAFFSGAALKGENDNNSLFFVMVFIFRIHAKLCLNAVYQFTVYKVQIKHLSFTLWL